MGRTYNRALKVEQKSAQPVDSEIVVRNIYPSLFIEGNRDSILLIPRTFLAQSVLLLLYFGPTMNQRTQSILGILVPLFLLLGTGTVYFFAKGYRINISDRTIEKTGVISIKTFPKRADLYIDDELKGQSPKAFGGISEGCHTIRIEKEGYYSWSHEVTVTAEQLIPFEVQLFLKEPTLETLYEEVAEIRTNPCDIEGDSEGPDASIESPEEIVIDSDIVGFISDTENNVATYSILTTTQSCEENGTNSPPVRSLQTWSYPLKRQFWELNPQSQLIAEFTSETLGTEIETETPTVETLLSPNGEKSIISISLSDTMHHFVLETGSFNDDPQPLDALNTLPGLELFWSNDSRHIFYLQDNELRSIDSDTLSQNIITTIAQDETPFFWTTNTSGHIFFPSYSRDFMNIVQATSEGTNQQNIATFSLNPAPEELTDEEFSPIPSEDLRSIKEIHLTPTEDSLIIFSDQSIILYSIDGENHNLFPAENPVFLSFSPNDQSFIYRDEDHTTLSEFCYQAEDNDPLHKIGPRQLLDLHEFSEISQFTWHPQGYNVFFHSIAPDQDTGFINALDTETCALYSLTRTDSAISLGVENSGSSMVTMCSDSEICTVTFHE